MEWNFKIFLLYTFIFKINIWTKLYENIERQVHELLRCQFFAAPPWRWSTKMHYVGQRAEVEVAHLARDHRQRCRTHCCRTPCCRLHSIHNYQLFDACCHFLFPLRLSLLGWNIAVCWPQLRSVRASVRVCVCLSIGWYMRVRLSSEGKTIFLAIKFLRPFRIRMMCLVLQVCINLPKCLSVCESQAALVLALGPLWLGFGVVLGCDLISQTEALQLLLQSLPSPATLRQQEQKNQEGGGSSSGGGSVLPNPRNRPHFSDLVWDRVLSGQKDHRPFAWTLWMVALWTTGLTNQCFFSLRRGLRR